MEHIIFSRWMALGETVRSPIKVTIKVMAKLPLSRESEATPPSLPQSNKKNITERTMDEVCGISAVAPFLLSVVR